MRRPLCVPLKPMCIGVLHYILFNHQKVALHMKCVYCWFIFSMVSFIWHLFILRTNQTFITTISVPPSSCAVLCCILDVQLFFQPQHIH